LAEASVDRSPPEWKDKRFQENVFFSEAKEKGFERIKRNA